MQSRKLRVVGYQNRRRERGARRRKEGGEQERNRRGSREPASRTQDGGHETKGRGVGPQRPGISGSECPLQPPSSISFPDHHGLLSQRDAALIGLLICKMGQPQPGPLKVAPISSEATSAERSVRAWQGTQAEPCDRDRWPAPPVYSAQ